MTVGLAVAVAIGFLAGYAVRALVSFRRRRRYYRRNPPHRFTRHPA